MSSLLSPKVIGDSSKIFGNFPAGVSKVDLIKLRAKRGPQFRNMMNQSMTIEHSAADLGAAHRARVVQRSPLATDESR